VTVLSAPKIEQLARAKDPKQALIDAVGDLDKAEVFADLVLLGTYIRNEMTPGGIIRPIDNVKEDENQGKIGLVLKSGPLAFGDWEEDEDRGKSATLHTWVVFHNVHAWQIQLNGVPCRLIPYDKIRMSVTDPTLVF
jgi:hypothetical protein